MHRSRPACEKVPQKKQDNVSECHVRHLTDFANCLKFSFETSVVLEEIKGREENKGIYILCFYCIGKEVQDRNGISMGELLWIAPCNGVAWIASLASCGGLDYFPLLSVRRWQGLLPFFQVKGEWYHMDLLFLQEQVSKFMYGNGSGSSGYIPVGSRVLTVFGW